MITSFEANFVAPDISGGNSSTVVCVNEKVFSCMSGRLGEWKDQCSTFVRDLVIVLFLQTLLDTFPLTLFPLHGFGVACQGPFLSQEAALLLISTKNRVLCEVQFSGHAQSNRFVFAARQN